MTRLEEIIAGIPRVNSEKDIPRAIRHVIGKRPDRPLRKILAASQEVPKVSKNMRPKLHSAACAADFAREHQHIFHDIPPVRHNAEIIPAVHALVDARNQNIVDGGDHYSTGYFAQALFWQGKVDSACRQELEQMAGAADFYEANKAHFVLSKLENKEDVPITVKELVAIQQELSDVSLRYLADCAFFSGELDERCQVQLRFECSAAEYALRIQPTVEDEIRRFYTGKRHGLLKKTDPHLLVTQESLVADFPSRYHIPSDAKDFCARDDEGNRTISMTLEDWASLSGKSRNTLFKRLKMKSLSYSYQTIIRKCIRYLYGDELMDELDSN
jgi:hypothetical protein